MILFSLFSKRNFKMLGAHYNNFVFVHKIYCFLTTQINCNFTSKQWLQDLVEQVCISFHSKEMLFGILLPLILSLVIANQSRCVWFCGLIKSVRLTVSSCTYLDQNVKRTNICKNAYLSNILHMDKQLLLCSSPWMHWILHCH
jgi:hypothetical protein